MAPSTDNMRVYGPGSNVEMYQRMKQVRNSRTYMEFRKQVERATKIYRKFTFVKIYQTEMNLVITISKNLTYHEVQKTWTLCSYASLVQIYNGTSPMDAVLVLPPPDPNIGLSPQPTRKHAHVSVQPI